MQNADPKPPEPDFRALFESLPIACLVFRPDDLAFTIVAASDPYLEANRLPREHLLGRGLSEVFPQGADEVLASLRRVVETGQADQMSVQRHDIPVMTDTGPRFEQRYWNPVNKPVLKDNGVVQYIIHWVEEITGKVLASQQLQTSEKRFRQIAETSQFGLAIAGLDGKLSYANPALLHILGEVPITFSVLETEAANQLAATGKCTPFERTFIAADGRHVPILIAASLLEPAGGQQEAALFVLDLTERKQSERDALLVRLDDEIRPLTDSDTILETGIRLLAEYLGINPAGPFALDFAAAMQPHASGQPFCLQAPRPWLPAEMVLLQLVVNRCREAAERGRITRDLQDSERRLRLSQRAARIGSYEWLPKEGRVIWTPELEALFGLREGEFEGNFDGWAKRATPEDAQRLGAELQACLASRQTEYSCEFRAVLPDGKRRWLYAYIQLFYDEAGVFERALGVNMDIDARKHAENSLNRQRQIFDGAFSHSPDHYYTFDLEGRVTYANRALLSIWRKPLEEVLGKNFFELDYTAEMAALLSSQIQQVISTGKHLKDQTAYTAADGNSKHYDYVFLPVFNSDGQVEAVAGSTRDISEQARAAELLEQDRRRWRDLLLQTPAAIAVLRGPEHHYEWFNDGYLRLVGRSAEALNGKGLREALPELISQGFADIFDRAYQTGVPYVNHEAHALLGENGVNEMYVDFVCLPTRDSEGQVDGVFVHATDITDAVMARRLLEESERRYRFLAESMPQMVWTATSEGVLDYASRQAAAPSPSGWLSGIHPEDESRALELWSDCVRTRSPYQNEMRLRYALTEDWHWFLVRALPMNAPEGGVICWVGTCTDIQYQKQAEEALRKANRELEEFAYVASHDLQEPLRMVSVYAHLLRKGLGADADATLIHYAGVVLQCVSRMEALIHDILEFSRVAHSEEPSGEKADLAASFTEALLVLKNRIEEKGAVISAPQRLPVVRGETQHLTHVFQNLLSNALKYSKKEEPPAIEILSRRDGDNWIISVADNGIGFDQQYAARIFGLFKRLHKTEYPGTGLGLAICQRIVERYGGRMWAEGHSGEGAVFSFALPCADD